MTTLKVFVINLKRSPERFEVIKQQLDNQNINFERFNAVDGAELKDFTENFNLKRFSLESMHDLVPGEAGCSWSHIHLWEKIRSEKIDHALVLEDDVVLTDRLKAFLSDKDNYKDFDYLKLDNTSKDIAEALHCNESEITKHTIDVWKKNEYHLYEVDPVPYATGGYIISNKAALTFLKASKNMYYPIDLLPRYTFPYTRQGVVTPALIAHLNNESNIEARTYNTSNEQNRLITIYNKINNKRRFRQISVLFTKLVRIIFRKSNV